MSRQHSSLWKSYRNLHTLFAIQPDGIGRIGSTSKGSQNAPALPVIQHLFMSRLLMSRCVLASGRNGGRPAVVTANCQATAFLDWLACGRPAVDGKTSPDSML